MWLPPPIGRGNPTHPPSKPSLQEASLNCTLRQVSPVAAPGSPPQRLAASHGKRLVCRLRSLCVLLSFPHPDWDCPFVTRAWASEGSSQRRPEPHAPSCTDPPCRSQRGASCRAVWACSWRLVQGDRDMSATCGSGGALHGEEGGQSSHLGVLFHSCCLLVEQLAWPLPARRETNRRHVTSVRPPGPLGHTKALSLLGT